jgi:hypothetical protein
VQFCLFLLKVIKLLLQQNHAAASRYKTEKAAFSGSFFKTKYIYLLRLSLLLFQAR